MSTDSSTPPRSPAERTRLGRFRLGRQLGEGGMGRVFEAEDPHLRRTVAIKVLRDSSLVNVHRFLREARVQGSLEHPGICPIYEAGEDAGKPYIVMQRIRGRRLDEVAEALPSEARLKLLSRVAEAVHAAHREGLIHRDIKPGNVMVEEAEDGSLRPIVLDFGLARMVDEEGLTRAGEAHGTPGFMAPEQIHAEKALDRRTDVYALGATLYYLLAGRAPFGVADSDQGPSDPRLGLAPSLRKQGVPVEVEAIVFRCLELEPDQRYDSARALADDIERYLDGRPVEARAAGPSYRLRKHLQRNKTLWAGVLGVSVIVAAALGWGVATRLQADERERLARSLGEQVREVEALARYAHMAPLHDLRSDRELLRQRIEGIRERAEEEPNWGGGHYSVGRGLLALGETRAALDSLELAWESDYRGPETATALVEASSQLYRERLVGPELARDWRARQHRVRQLDQEYGERILDWLEHAPPSPYLQALRHFHAGSFEEALDSLAQAGDRPSWAYEWAVLEGDILRSLGIRAAAASQPADAVDAWAKAQDAYTRASAIAPSDPRIHRAAARTAFLELQSKALSREPVKGDLEAGLERLDKASSADPDDPRNQLWKARLLRTAASIYRTRGQDPSEILDRAQDAIGFVRAELPELDAELARIHWGRAQWQRSRGIDPTDALREGIEAIERLAMDRRGYDELLTSGLLHMTLGDAEATASPDTASESYASASDTFERAADFHSHPFAARTNQGVALYKSARLPVDEDVLPILERAIGAFRQALVLEPENVAPLYYSGRARLLIAQGGSATSGALDPTLAARAMEDFLAALELAPHMFQLHSGLAEIHHLLALGAWDDGRDPAPHFDRARESYGRASEQVAGHPVLRTNLAWTAYFQGKHRLRRGTDPEPYLAEALALVSDGARLLDHSGARSCAASVWRLRAEWALLGGHDPGPAIERARALFEELATRDPALGESHRSLGRLHTLAGRIRIARGEDPSTDFERAKSRLDRAISEVPEGAPHFLARARLAFHWSANLAAGDRHAIADWGIESAEACLRLRPGWAEAETVKARLELLLDIDDPHAREDLKAALDANPHLRFEWGGATERPDRDRSATRR